MSPRRRSAVLVTALVLAGWWTQSTSARQQPSLDPERVLAQRLGFSDAEVAAVRAGQAVTRLLPSREKIEVAVAGAVRVSGTPDRLVYWLKEISNFRRAAELGTAAKLSTPPQVGDFAGLSLSDEDLADLKACRPGKCELRLGEKAAARFREIDWSAPDAASRANLLTRELMLQLAQAYLQGGDAALGASYSSETPRVSADEFRALFAQSTNLQELAPPLVSFLQRFPAARLDGGEHFLYWAQGGAAKAGISLHQFLVSPSSDGGAVIADKQIFSTRYTDAALFVVSLSPTADKTAYYVVVGGRARSRMLGGTAARLLRGRVESATRDTVKMYLTWLQGSMAQAR